MKIIFCDVDGVLNDENTPLNTELDDEKILLLKEIVEKTNAKIVLSSAQKLGWEPKYEKQGPYIRYLFDKLKYFELIVIDRTYDPISLLNRGEGIYQWLSEHENIESWVVLDDEIFPDFEKFGIIPHLVHTQFYGYGLTSELAAQAIKILNGELNDDEKYKFK